MRRFPLLITSALLWGCATTTQVHFVNPGHSDAEGYQVAYQCMREAAGQGGSGYAVGNVAAAQSGTQINSTLVRACMAAHGWQETR